MWLKQLADLVSGSEDVHDTKEEESAGEVGTEDPPQSPRTLETSDDQFEPTSDTFQKFERFVEGKGGKVKTCELEATFPNLKPSDIQKHFTIASAGDSFGLTITKKAGGGALATTGAPRHSAPDRRDPAKLGADGQTATAKDLLGATDGLLVEAPFAGEYRPSPPAAEEPAPNTSGKGGTAEEAGGGRAAGDGPGGGIVAAAEHDSPNKAPPSERVAGVTGDPSTERQSSEKQSQSRPLRQAPPPRAI